MNCNDSAVFIIDDDPSARKGLMRLVIAAGLNAETFGSAQDFLDSGKAEGPGCIVLDVKMPEMTGLEVDVLDAHEIASKLPGLRVDDLAGALWVAADGQANMRAACCHAMAVVGPGSSVTMSPWPKPTENFACGASSLAGKPKKRPSRSPFWCWIRC